jgi:hypothetical protein
MYCHAHSRDALGHLRSRPSGMWTSPAPTAHNTWVLRECEKSCPESAQSVPDAGFLTPSDSELAEICGGMRDRRKMTLQISPICGHLLV